MQYVHSVCEMVCAGSKGCLGRQFLLQVRCMAVFNVFLFHRVVAEQWLRSSQFMVAISQGAQSTSQTAGV